MSSPDINWEQVRHGALYGVTHDGPLTKRAGTRWEVYVWYTSEGFLASLHQSVGSEIFAADHVKRLPTEQAALEWIEDQLLEVA